MKRVFLALLSAALCWAAFPPLAWAPAGWVALAPLLLALEGATARQGRILGFLFGTAFFAASASWLFGIFAWGSVGLWAFLGLFGSLFGALVALAGDRGWAWRLLGIPALWVGIEWLRAEGNPLRFGWFVLGLSQSSSPRMLQAADLAGAYGLSFLMVSVSSALVFGLKRRRSFAVAALVVVGVAVYGTWALGHWDRVGTVPAAVVQGEDVSEKDLRGLTRDLGIQGPRLVVWPELALPFDPTLDPVTMGALQGMVREMGTVLVVGCTNGTPLKKGWDNRALVLGPDGGILGDYVKHVPIQFFDDGVAGRGFPTFPTPAGRLGICICYDLDFPWVTRGLVRAGAEVLAVPTYDAVFWGETQHRQHTANARVRAVTHRRFLVRACSSGISQVIAPDGRIEAEVPGKEKGAAVGRVAPVSGLSPCDRGGWLLAPLCAVWGAVVAMRLLWTRVGSRIP